jgi:hypothetical protein
MSWHKAFEYIKTMNQSALYGRTDWRLPNIRELQSLVNHNAPNAAEWLTESGFRNVRTICWTSNTYAVDPDFAWCVWFHHSHAPNAPRKTRNYYLWPVSSRGIIPETGAYEIEGYECLPTEDGNTPVGIGWPEPRFLDHKNGTITDNMTGLMWMKNGDISGLINYADALDFLKELNV